VRGVYIMFTCTVVLCGIALQDCVVWAVVCGVAF